MILPDVNLLIHAYNTQFPQVGANWRRTKDAAG